MSPVHNEEDSQLIANLHALSKKSPKLVKSSLYSAPADPEIKVRSWKMNEFKYYDVPSPFPTLARGIFTVELPDAGRETSAPKYRIVARGYDKFFNIGEVPWTTWASLEAHTAAPYTLSLKSNGCIIFIAALTPSKLLITSKHSIGPVAGSSVSHAEAGEEWLRKYIGQKGRTEAEFAARLWENNWTAIAELCDDSFEEHVLGYPPDKTGLHLHGINESTKHFKTLSHPEVDAFADEWGFIKTLSTTLNSIAEVRSFTDDVGKTGKWKGEAVEGFVVRTHVTEPPAGLKAASASPYAPGSSFFFKVKFDEPYMMYRDWREVTKTLLSTKDAITERRVPKSKMKRAETRVYVRWVINEIKRDRRPFEGFTKGKGIIATREKFLKWAEETEEGREEMRKAKGGEDVGVVGVNIGVKQGKTIIVPVAIPGCGKTAVAVALAHIFGFGHTQSDDVHVKKAAPVFIKNVVGLLKDHDVVIADKNNHLRQHRQSLRDATSTFDPPVRLLALNWSLDKPPSTVHRICGDRVLHRGDNHQTLRPNAQSKAHHEEVIWQFITGTEELADSEVDETIEMDLEETLEEAVWRAVNGCVDVLGLEKPSEERVQEALEVVGGYAPATKKADEIKKKGTPRYFGLLPEVDLVTAVGKRIELGGDVSKESKDFWAGLKVNGRITKRPHVTIVHKNSLPEEAELWERCMVLQEMETPPLFRFKLGNVVWDDRVMAVTVDDLEVEGGGQEGQEFVAKLWEEIKRRLHITVGTRDSKVLPVEAKALVEKWRAGGEEGRSVKSMKLEGTVVKGRIKALFN